MQCIRCGGNLTGSAINGNGGQYYYYHCQKGCKERFRADAANTRFIEHLRSIQIAPEVASLYLAVIQDIFNAKEGDREKQIAVLQQKLLEHEERLLKVDERFVDGELQSDSYHRLKESIQSKQRETERQSDELKNLDTNMLRYARYGLALVANLAQHYGEAPLEVKQKLIGLIYPEKLTYNDGEYQTTKVSEVIGLLCGKSEGNIHNEKGLTAVFGNQSYSAPRVGLG